MKIDRFEDEKAWQEGRELAKMTLDAAKSRSMLEQMRLSGTHLIRAYEAE